MNNNVILFPNISEQKLIDLKKASMLTGLGYPLLYKIIVIQGQIGYYKINKKILVDVSDLQNLMEQNFIAKKGFNYDNKEKSN